MLYAFARTKLLAIHLGQPVLERDHFELADHRPEILFRHGGGDHGGVNGHEHGHENDHERNVRVFSLQIRHSYNVNERKPRPDFARESQMSGSDSVVGLTCHFHVDWYL